MKKVLILAYDFPPYTSMGSQRPYGWYLYLKELGYEPTVITRQWPENISSKIDYHANVGSENIDTKSSVGRILQVPYKSNIRDRIVIKYGFSKFKLLRKILSLFQQVFQFASFRFDNKSVIYFAAQNLLQKEAFDLIITTGEPFVLFKYAYKLNKYYGIPWIADYRDCWSDNFEINRNGGFDKFLHKSIYKRIEKKYVNTATGITTAASFFQKQLSQLFPLHNIQVIYNGFHELIQNSEKKTNTKNFTIAFAGTIYPFQPIEMFLDGLQLFLSKFPTTKINVVFYGLNWHEEQKRRVTEYKSTLTPFLRTTDRLNREALFQELHQSDVLLLLDNKGMISGKLYEYLALQRPILMAGNDWGSMGKIIKDTNSGYVCNTVLEIKIQLESLYYEWESNGFIVNSPVNIEQYSRKAQTQKLAQLLDQIV